MASVLLYSADLLRVDLDGIFTLLPSIIEALESVLPPKDIRVRYDEVDTLVRCVKLTRFFNLNCIQIS